MWVDSWTVWCALSWLGATWSRWLFWCIWASPGMVEATFHVVSHPKANLGCITMCQKSSKRQTEHASVVKSISILGVKLAIIPLDTLVTVTVQEHYPEVWMQDAIISFCNNHKIIYFLKIVKIDAMNILVHVCSHKNNFYWISILKIDWWL